jgi:hypothetical protein
LEIRGSEGRTKRCSEREPADSLRDKSNVIGGWLPSLTFTLGGKPMSLLSFLSEADFVSIVAVNSAILCFSFPAYRRTKMKAFAFLFSGSLVGIIASATLHMHDASPSPDPNDPMTFLYFYRSAFIVGTVLKGIGTILLIRHALGSLQRKDTNAA